MLHASVRAALCAILVTALFAPLPAAAAVARPFDPATLAAPLDGPAGMRLLVRFSPDATRDDVLRALHTVGGAIQGTIGALGVTRVVLPGGANDAFGDGDAVAAYLARDPAVSSAELDATVHLDLTPNDAYYANDPYTGLGQWGIRKAFVDKAWDVVRGSPSVIVATIDTGIDPTHPELASAVLSGARFVAAPTTGCGTAANDDNGHGTHVAGIIGAAGNNGIGIAGVAYGVKILPVKTLDCEGSGSTGDVAQGITWAVDHGARIVNVSLGSTSNSTTMRNAVVYAAGKNVLVVAAAGNCGQVGGTCGSLNEVSYPGAYPEVLAVGATDVDDTRAFFSTQASYVGISAPGRKIVSTLPTYPSYLSTHGATQSYSALSGTSQAAPFVAGAAALVMSADPTLTAKQVSDRLKATADDLGTAGADSAFGAGRVNAFRAVTATSSTVSYGAIYDVSAIPTTATAGGSLAGSVKVTNTSSFTWASAGTSAIRLTSQWLDLSGNVLATGAKIALPNDVAAGASVTLPVVLAVPAGSGVRLLRFDLAQDNGPSFATKGVATGNVPVTVGSGAATTTATYTLTGAGPAFTIGTRTTVPVTLANTGTTTWIANGATPVHLSYHWLGATGALVTWEGERTSLASDVAPGATAVLGLAVTPPVVPGTYTLRIDLVQEGVSWFSGLGVPTRDLVVLVSSGLVASYTVGQPPTLLPGGRYALPVTIRNDGIATWNAAGPNPVHIAAHLSDFTGATVLWDGERTDLATDVAPGASVTSTVFVAAPLIAGGYRVRVDLVKEGVSWFSGLAVPPGDGLLSVAADFRAVLSSGPLTVSRASPFATVTITNASGATWTPGGAAPVAVAAHWLDAAGNVLVWDGPRTLIATPVAPAESVTIRASLGPVPDGATQVVIDVVADGLRWFGVGPARPVTLIP
ncbi:MAG: S8 family serine peptidase [Chloroflexi bacterium]|nr:S8 family serine peptidase [Chloroflexota bacterium]